MTDLEQEINDFLNKQTQTEDELIVLGKSIKTYTNIAWFLVAFGLLSAIIGLFHFFNPTCSPTKLNELGDYLGGATASIWSLAGIFFIYVAFLGQKQQLINQKQEIRLNQIEFRATRKELEGQKEQIKLQNDTLKKQQFESTFFNLLQNYNDIINNVEVEVPNRTIRIGYNPDKEYRKSKGSFQVFYSELKHKTKNNCINGTFFEDKKATIETANIAITKVSFLDFYNFYQSDLGHYFRNLYHIFKFIDNSDIRDKKFYTSLVRAQLSQFELAILFYNCLVGYGEEKFKPLVEKYALLKSMDGSHVFNPEHIKLYEKQAYGSNVDHIWPKD